MYCKAGGYPWSPHGLAQGTCYVGIGVYRPLGSRFPTMQTSLVQAFDEHGEGLFLRGHDFDWDPDKTGSRSPHLSADDAARLMGRVLDQYERHMHQTPARVVAHKMSRFWPDERDRGCGRSIYAGRPPGPARQDRERLTADWRELAAGMPNRVSPAPARRPARPRQDRPQSAPARLPVCHERHGHHRNQPTAIPGHGPGTLVNLASEIGCSRPKRAVAALLTDRCPAAPVRFSRGRGQTGAGRQRCPGGRRSTLPPGRQRC
jgi:hypothetical protein